MEPLTPDDPTSVGRYRLLARLGAGGMGRVYLARTAARKVVVKTIRPEIAHDPEFHARFAREVTLARKVAGPYTAAVIDADPGADPPWLVTEYIEGPSLHAAVTRRGAALPESSLPLLAAGLAEALVDIHRVGIVHRDLKPANVLLAADAPRVIDFGIAKAVVEATLTPLTAVGHVLGTPSYMPPEQVLGRAAVPAGDVFALGGVLYFAAAGVPPFGAADQALFFRILNTEPDMGRVPGPWRELVGACLAKEPGDRPTPEAVLATVGEVDLDGGAWLPPEVYAAARGSEEFGPPLSLTPEGFAAPAAEGSDPDSTPTSRVGSADEHALAEAPGTENEAPGTPGTGAPGGTPETGGAGVYGETPGTAGAPDGGGAPGSGGYGGAAGQPWPGGTGPAAPGIGGTAGTAGAPYGAAAPGAGTPGGTPGTPEAGGYGGSYEIPGSSVYGGAAGMPETGGAGMYGGAPSASGAAGASGVAGAVGTPYGGGAPGAGAVPWGAQAQGVPAAAHVPGGGQVAGGAPGWWRGRPVGAGWFWGMAVYAVVAAAAVLSPDLWYTAALLPCVLVPPLLVLQQGLRTSAPGAEAPAWALVVRWLALLLSLPLVLFSAATFLSGTEEMIWAHGDAVYRYLPLTLGLPLLFLLDPPPVGSPLRAKWWAVARWAAVGVYLVVLAVAFVYHRDETEGLYQLDWETRLLWASVLGVCAILAVLVSLLASVRTGGARAPVAVPSALAAVGFGVAGVLSFVYSEPDAVWLVYENPVPWTVLATAALTAGALVAAVVSRGARA
ncbi:MULTISPECIES: serine/threonine-protein kinase [unclassified Nocardiopsis]|uniref:serine/threonine-protein kinase n=1 Tax=Nocardiopsis TaxID=2013 RepID=UPI00387AA215